MKINTDPPTGDEENPHDQLPSPEEYKAGMNNGSSYSMRDYDPQYDDDDNDHDLPSVDEYKNQQSFRENEERPKSRAGLWTFLCLVLLLIIITAIAVPLALRGKGGKDTSKNASTSGGSVMSESDTGTILTATPAARPTRPPTRPPVVNDLPRGERARKYLTEFGIADEGALNDPTSPQAKAFKWITEDDAYQIEIPNPLEGNNGLPYSDTRFTERYALAVFYYSTGGGNWFYKLNFLEPVDHCDWYAFSGAVRLGVSECQKFEPNFDMDKVSKIYIPGENNLIGNVPSEIKYFPNLQAWVTPFNLGLTTASTLDSFINLAGGSLSHLEVQYCGIVGKIPDTLGTMTNLAFLGLGNNQLTGLIPESFFGLSNLITLGIDDNLLEGSIDKFAKFTKIQKMYIEDNLIEGQITEAMITNGWPEMVDLDASVNRMSGVLPANLFSMTALEVVDLHGNDFVGNIPEFPALDDSLSYLSLQDNSLVGNLPESIVNATNLRHLDVSANLLTLPFPSTMSQMTNLVSLHTGINGFTDHPLPDFLAGMTNLKELSMKQNSLTGEIPTFIGELRQLVVLDLDFNKLKGEIPMEIGSLNKLDHLLLNRNFLTGTFPASFFGLVDIDVLLLDGNELTGDAGIICNNPDLKNMTAFSADCAQPNPEVTCTCCTICCADTDPDCNNAEWRINLDGIWEYNFDRVVYRYSTELLPAGAKDAYTVDGDGEAPANDGDERL